MDTDIFILVSLILFFFNVSGELTRFLETSTNGESFRASSLVSFMLTFLTPSLDDTGQRERTLSRGFSNGVSKICGFPVTSPRPPACEVTNGEGDIVMSSEQFLSLGDLVLVICA